MFALFWVGHLDFGGERLVGFPLLVWACTLLQLIALGDIWYAVYACLGDVFCCGFV